MQKNKIISINDSYLLIISSCFFIIPALIAFTKKIFFLSILSTITTIVSVNYWRNAIVGFRRNMDLITAKVSFIIYFTVGIFCIKDIKLYTIGIPGVFAIGFFYYMSNKYWKLNSKLWIYFHMLFHLFVALEQSFVICSLDKKYLLFDF
jgi:hypothetical protein